MKNGGGFGNSVGLWKRSANFVSRSTIILLIADIPPFVVGGRGFERGALSVTETLLILECLCGGTGGTWLEVEV